MNSKYLSGRPKYKVKKIKGKTYYVHRLILKVKPGFIVHHVNGNSLDNRISNLKVVTYSQHALEHMKMGWKPKIGGVTSTSFKKGELNPFYKFSDKTVKEIRKERKEGMEVKEISKRHKISLGHTYDLLSGRKRSRSEILKRLGG